MVTSCRIKINRGCTAAGRRGCAGGVRTGILLAVITLVVAGAGVYAVLRTGQARQEEYHRKAVVISEEGLLRALEKIRDNPSWSEGFPRVPYEGGIYEVTLARAMKTDAVYLTVKSSGRIGKVQDVKECLLMLSVTGGDSVWVRQDMY